MKRGLFRNRSFWSLLLKSKGFTLLEVLVALVVFSILALSIYGILSQSFFVENYSEKKLNLALVSTEYIYTSLNNLPDETAGWKEVDTKSIDAYKIVKTPIGMFNIYRVDWLFKKGKVVIGYVLYE